MKTNHKRDYVADDDSFSYKRKQHKAKDPELGLIVNAFSGGHCVCNGPHGAASDRRGAKKFTHSRLRAKTKEAIHNLYKEENDGDC